VTHSKMFSEADAVRSTKKCFLESLQAKDVKVIRESLDITPDEFWRMVRQGERFGPDGIASFARSLEEKTKGYLLPFPPPEGDLVQIQPAPHLPSSTQSPA
jgi:hypothetical protein